MLGSPLLAVFEECGQIVLRHALAGLAQPLIVDAVEADGVGTRTDVNLQHLGLHLLVFIP